MSALVPGINIVASVHRRAPSIGAFHMGTPRKKGLFRRVPNRYTVIYTPNMDRNVFSVASSPAGGRCRRFDVGGYNTLASCLRDLRIKSRVAIHKPCKGRFPMRSGLGNGGLLFVTNNVKLTPLHSIVGCMLSGHTSCKAMSVLCNSHSTSSLMRLGRVRRI